MPCDNCGHTVHNLGLDDGGIAAAGRRSFWCPRCGALTTESVVYVSDAGRGGATPRMVPHTRRETSVPKWTEGDDGVPVNLLDLSLLNRLAQDAFAIDAAKAHLRGSQSRVAEADEAVLRPRPRPTPEERGAI